MKKLFLFLALVFLMQKSFAQCNTTTSGNSSFCGPGCFGYISLSSTGGTPPYSLTINSVFIGTYSSTYSASNMCGGIDTCIIVDNTLSCSDTVMVTIWENPYPGILMNVTNETCIGCCDGSISTPGSGLFAYQWSTGATTQAINNLCSGTYSVTVFDIEGCSASTSATVGVGIGGSCSASFMMVPSGSPHDYWVVNSSTGAAPLSYDWNWGDGSPHDNIAFPTHTYLAAGFYNITLGITDASGCTNMQVFNSYLARMEQVLTVTVVPSLPSGTEELSEENIFIFPNPASGKFTVEVGMLKQVQHDISVYNTLGEKILSQKINSPRTEINLSSQANGIYFVQLRNNEQTITRKIILSK